MACSSEEKVHRSNYLKTVAKKQNSFFIAYNQKSCLQLTFTRAMGCVLDTDRTTCQISFESLS